MNRVVHRARAAVAVAIAATLAIAAQPAAAGSVTLADLLTRALRQNPGLQELRQEGGLREAALTRAGRYANPVLELEGATGALTGSSKENSLSLGVSREFSLGGKRDQRLAVAARDREVHRWQVADRERLLREEVKTAYYGLLLARERLDLTTRAIGLSRQLLDVTRERLAVGDIPELEMNLVKVELARSEGARIDAERALVRSRSGLLLLTGDPPDEAPAPDGALDAAGAPLPGIGELLERAQATRPDLKALREEADRGDAELGLARAEGVPDLTAGIALKRDATAMEVGGVTGRDTAYTIGVKLALPIPLYDSNQAGVQEASSRRESAAARFRAAGRAVAREVETAWSVVRSSEQVLSLYRADILPQLEENLKLTQEAYRLGEVGLLAVIQEQKNFVAVSDGYLTALHDRQAALVRLEAAVGGPWE
jgi:cobalt-zinc-cadmium efflux system outer membrane protein